MLKFYLYFFNHLFPISTSFTTIPARHVGDRMYRGQTFVMQMDAHCQFVNHWDTKIIDQWSQTKNEMAVLRWAQRSTVEIIILIESG